MDDVVKPQDVGGEQAVAPFAPIHDSESALQQVEQTAEGNAGHTKQRRKRINEDRRPRHNEAENGESYGVSISIGRAYQLSKSWNFEWEIGAGALWMDYDKYLCKRCGDLVSRKHEWAFLPTRAALNIVYLF
jgi:hypothetical protein